MCTSQNVFQQHHHHCQAKQQMKVWRFEDMKDVKIWRCERCEGWIRPCWLMSTPEAQYTPTEIKTTDFCTFLITSTCRNFIIFKNHNETCQKSGRLKRIMCATDEKIWMWSTFELSNDGNLKRGNSCCCNCCCCCLNDINSLRNVLTVIIRLTSTREVSALRIGGAMIYTIKIFGGKIENKEK